MKHVIISITIIIGAFLFLAPLSQAAEVYTWTDRHGVTHISDTPPQQPVRLKSVDKFRRGSGNESYSTPDDRPHPRAIRRQRSRDVDNVIMERAADSSRRSSSVTDDKERKRQEIEDLEAKSRRYQQYQTDAHSNTRKQYYLDEKKKIDRELEQKKREY